MPEKEIETRQRMYNTFLKSVAGSVMNNGMLHPDFAGRQVRLRKIFANHGVDPQVALVTSSIAMIDYDASMGVDLSRGFERVNTRRHDA
jgi:hypothetical protein